MNEGGGIEVTEGDKGPLAEGTANAKALGQEGACQKSTEEGWRVPRRRKGHERGSRGLAEEGGGGGGRG